MQTDKLIRIKNANYHLKALAVMNKNFLSACAELEVGEGLESEISFESNAIVVSALGYRAKAECHYVRSVDDEFFAEYVFYAQMGDDKVEIWRFYLTEFGQVYETPSIDHQLFDYDNRNAVKNICANVIIGMLNSALFSPAPTACQELDEKLI